MVERQCQQLLRGGHPALHERDLGRVEQLGHQFGDERVDVGREFGRLQDHRVARRDGRHQRAEQGVHRVVPGADDQAAPARLEQHPSTRAQRGERGPHALWPHPARQVRDGVARFVHHRQQLGQVDLQRWLAQVGREGGVPGLAAAQQAIAQPLEFGHALAGGGAAQRECAWPLLLEEALNGVRVGIVDGEHRQGFHRVGNSLRSMRVIERLGNSSATLPSKFIVRPPCGSQHPRGGA